MTGIECLSVPLRDDPIDAIFETWFSTMNLNVSREDAKIIYYAGVNVGKSANLIMPRNDQRLRAYTQPAIAHEEKLLLTA